MLGVQRQEKDERRTLETIVDQQEWKTGFDPVFYFVPARRPECFPFGPFRSRIYGLFCGFLEDPVIPNYRTLIVSVFLRWNSPLFRRRWSLSLNLVVQKGSLQWLMISGTTLKCQLYVSFLCVLKNRIWIRIKSSKSRNKSSASSNRRRICENMPQSFDACTSPSQSCCASHSGNATKPSIYSTRQPSSRRNECIGRSSRLHRLSVNAA